MNRSDHDKTVISLVPVMIIELVSAIVLLGMAGMLMSQDRASIAPLSFGVAIGLLCFMIVFQAKRITIRSDGVEIAKLGRQTRLPASQVQFCQHGLSLRVTDQRRGTGHFVSWWGMPGYRAVRRAAKRLNYTVS